MRIQSINLTNFRPFDNHAVNFNTDKTVIHGPNGTGKTSILEAIYIALRGVSFRDSDQSIVKHNLPFYQIEAKFTGGEIRNVRYESNESSKQFLVHGVKSRRLKHEYKYPVILFDPEDTRIVTGSPTRRRQYIDTLISQIDPVYARAVRQYERALKQRNTLLKTLHRSADERFVWEVALSRLGSTIIKSRLQYTNHLNERISDTYGRIAQKNTPISITYNHVAASEQDLMNEINHNRKKDETLGTTTVGPHRHDIEFSFAGSDMKHMASRGEIRTVIVALKNIENDIIQAVTGKKPIILFDDVFSELDELHRNHIAFDNQIIITHAE